MSINESTTTLNSATQSIQTDILGYREEITNEISHCFSNEEKLEEVVEAFAEMNIFLDMYCNLSNGQRLGEPYGNVECDITKLPDYISDTVNTIVHSAAMDTWYGLHAMDVTNLLNSRLIKSFNSLRTPESKTPLRPMVNLYTLGTERLKSILDFFSVLKNLNQHLANNIFAPENLYNSIKESYDIMIKKINDLHTKYPTTHRNLNLYGSYALIGQRFGRDIRQAGVNNAQLTVDPRIVQIASQMFAPTYASLGAEAFKKFLK